MALDRAKSVAELLGSTTMAKAGRERLVDVAIELFYTFGFGAVGLDRVLTEAGVTKTTFYKHFESKNDLIIAAIKKRDDWENKAWQRAVKSVAGDSPKGQLIAMFDVFDIWFNDPDFRGCLFINAAVEFPDPNDQVHQVAAAYKRRTRDHFRDLATRAGATDPESFADTYTMMIEGTLVLRQVHGRDDAAKLARPVVIKLLDEYIPS